MHILVFGIFICCVHVAQAQSTIESLRKHDDYIINATAYNEGAYKTFEEFKYNNPSMVEGYIFKGRNLWFKDKDTDKLKKIKKKEVWGFCDGSKIFVRHNKYNEMSEKGRYCYYKEKGTKIIFALS